MTTENEIKPAASAEGLDGGRCAVDAGFGFRRWKAGDRVTREVFMDDGTWERLGDKCLGRSPLKHGEVVKRSERRSDEILVRWDDGTERAYLDHGVQEELPHTRPNA